MGKSDLAKMGAAFAMAGFVALAGCVDTQSPYQNDATPEKPAPVAGIKVETLLRADFLEPLPDGLHKITIPAHLMGTEADQECRIITDFIPAGNASYSYSANLGCRDVSAAAAPAAP